MKLSDFFAIRFRLASPQEILSWSHGEVTKPETINYRTQKPEKDGLFDEAIFGPTKDYECYCGKYRRIRYKGVVCDRCGVEVTRSIVRRERMGHIRLASPVAHIWFLRSAPSTMGLVLDVSVSELERVIYFAGYVVTQVDEEARQEALKEVEREYRTKTKQEKAVKEPVAVHATATEDAGARATEDATARLGGASAAGKTAPRRRADDLDQEDAGARSGTADDRREDSEMDLKVAYQKAREELLDLKKYQILSEFDYRRLSLKYGHIFQAGSGSEAVKKLLEEIDLNQLRVGLESELREAPESLKKKVARRLRLVRGMVRANVRPEWMFLTALPVLPPDLRPMVQLDGGRYATSDLNDLYRRVINRNSRLKKLLDLHAPDVIVRNEKRMLQEAVDALIDNSIRHGQNTQQQAVGGRARPLRSLADMLKGKQGRFRQNLLGKRVDYSGRSVIVVGPELKLGQCGLPKRMALELFRPFVINKLVERGIAHNIRSAGRIIEDEGDEVWAILEEVIKGKYVFLNRAPTLHRLSIQAFQPVLIEGLAIRIHPLVTTAFNADFDGDQMAVHLPITAKAQEEARTLMLSTHGLLKPATGDPIAYPTRDMVLGCFWLTRIQPDAKGAGKRFSSKNEAVLAYENGFVALQAAITVPDKSTTDKEGKTGSLETSVGRIIFNTALPGDAGYVNEEMSSKAMRQVMARLIERDGHESAAEVLDKIKQIGFEYATRSGISWGMDDLSVPKEKPALLDKADDEIEQIRKNYEEGLLTDDERRILTIEVWQRVWSAIEGLVPNLLPPFGSVATMIRSGARGSWNQPVQMMGMRGLMANPSGEIIELPVRSSLKEGMNVLEYFISTHGARKGTADTALRTSAAGYLTRRLVDVCQDVVVRDEDCGDAEGITVWREDTKELGKTFIERLRGRVSLEKKDKGALIGWAEARAIEESGAPSYRVRSVTTCRTRYGICRQCYGWDLSSNALVALGTPVGIIAAQAIGEPGTQLTMRTFHTGGVAGGADITQGLPRVEELFEARQPKGKAVISEVEGLVESIKEETQGSVVNVATDDGIALYMVPRGTTTWVKAGDKISPGQQLGEGHVDLKELYTISGVEAVRRYIIHEVQKIYSLQGADINDRHIEVIVRQMFSRVRIKESGDTTISEGEVVEQNRFEEENEQVERMGGKQAEGQTLLMGITKVALSTESVLSAASFQETTRVLIQASVEGRIDRLRGLKENVIIGRLVPAGTGFRKK